MADAGGPTHSGYMFDVFLSRYQSLRRTPAGLLIFAGAAVPALSFLPPGIKHALHTRGVLHPWYHLVAFAALTFIFLRSARTVRARLLCITGAVLMGCGTEIAQGFVYHYPVEQLDIAADTLGVVCGALLVLLTIARVLQASRSLILRWMGSMSFLENPPIVVKLR